MKNIMLMNMKIFPGLFNKPVTLFEKGDQTRIKEIREEINKLNNHLQESDSEPDNKNPCSTYNNNILNMSLDDNEKWKNNYDENINKCRENDICVIKDKQTLNGECEGSKKCINDYYKVYIDTDEDVDKDFSSKYCPSSSKDCKFNQINTDDMSNNLTDLSEFGFAKTMKSMSNITFDTLNELKNMAIKSRNELASNVDIEKNNDSKKSSDNDSEKKSNRQICVRDTDKLRIKIKDLNNELKNLVGYSITLG